MGAHTYTWGFWLGVETPVVIFAVLLLILSRKHLRERRQRIRMAGFVVVLCVMGAGVALLAQESMDAVALMTSAFVLAVSILVLWSQHQRRHHAGALLLDLELGPSWTGWWSSPWWWYGAAVLWAGQGLLNLLSTHHPLWFASQWSMAFLSLVMAQVARGRRRFAVRERGVVLPSGYTPWKRIISYTLGDMILTMRLRSPLGTSSVSSQVELRGSPEQRQALRQLLSQYVPVLSQYVPEPPADTFESR